MRRRLQMGVLAVIVLAMGFTAYYGWKVGQEAQANASLLPDRMTPASVATLQLVVDQKILQRLDAESPQLTLVAVDGTRAAVLVWRARGVLTLTQVVALAPTHYRTLAITWPDGSRQDLPIDVDLTPAVVHVGGAATESPGDDDR